MPGETLFAALMAVHEEVGTLAKDGWNDQAEYSFAKGDTVVRKSRELLAKHGILWIRTGAELTPPTLAPGEIGRMSYVGNVKITGKLWHAAGELPISAEVPIVAMGARPHDKAWAASITFGVGYLLLGVLNQDKANEAEINNRKEPETCSKADADECTKLCYELAAARSSDNKTVHRHEVFAAAWVAVALQPDTEANPGNMTPGEAGLVLAWLRQTTAKLARLKAAAAQPEAPATEPDPPGAP
jgi:hypothetical protein